MPPGMLMLTLQAQRVQVYQHTSRVAIKWNWESSHA